MTTRKTLLREKEQEIEDREQSRFAFIDAIKSMATEFPPKVGQKMNTQSLGLVASPRSWWNSRRK